MRTREEISHQLHRIQEIRSICLKHMFLGKKFILDQPLNLSSKYPLLVLEVFLQLHIRMLLGQCCAPK